jgi:hypothetical protein
MDNQISCSTDNMKLSLHIYKAGVSLHAAVFQHQQDAVEKDSKNIVEIVLMPSD